jgi:hypothetical protein
MIGAILIIIAMGPLILLGAFVLADRLGLGIAERLLDWTMFALIGQWRAGAIINVVGGAALCAGGAWLAVEFDRPARIVTAMLLIAFGLWRVWRGLAAWQVSKALADEAAEGGKMHG